MHEGKRRILAFIVTVAAGGWLVAGCSASVSIGGPSTVPRHSVETEVATTLARQLNQPVPKVACPGDLEAKIGTGAFEQSGLDLKGTVTNEEKVEVNSVV